MDKDLIVALVKRGKLEVKNDRLWWTPEMYTDLVEVQTMLAERDYVSVTTGVKSAQLFLGVYKHESRFAIKAGTTPDLVIVVGV